MFLMRADPLLGQMGGGWAFEISSFLPQMALACRLEAISQGPTTLDFQGPAPSYLPS